MDLLVNDQSKNLRKTERGAPYALCGGSSATMTPCPDLVVAGNKYTVTATPRRLFRRGKEAKITFQLVAGIAPIKAPTKAPAKTPTKAPVSAPMSAPIPVPLPAPTPVAAPMTTPVIAPVVAVAPVQVEVAPKAAPVPSPVAAPVDVAAPVVAPVDAPVDAPFAAPEAAPVAPAAAPAVEGAPVASPVAPLAAPVAAPTAAPVAEPPVFSISTVAAYTSPTGTVWEVDTPYVTGGTSTIFSANLAIKNTNDDGLYRKERYFDSLKYAIPIENGSYEVILHTAELYSADNIRVFQAVFEQGTVNIVTGEVHIFDAVGYMNSNTANLESFTVTVSDGELNLEFVKILSDPQMCGIEIRKAPVVAPVAVAPASPAPAPSSYRISAGYSYTATNGDFWEPDTPYVTSGSIFHKGASTSIADTVEDGLYRKERWGGAMKYKLPLLNGAYIVTLHLVELVHTGASRVYNVTFEKGTANAVTEKIDVIGTIGTGAINTAYAAPFNVTVSDGELNIEFVSILDNPSVSGIEIVAATEAAPVAPIAPVAAPVSPVTAPAAPMAAPVAEAPVFSISTVSAYTSPTGKVWEVDTPYVTGGTSSTFPASNPIENTNDDGLYRKERYLDNMKYAIPIENGTYEVILHTAEL